MKRLPIYFIIDTKFEIGSESLSAVNNGLNILISSLKQNPHLIETADISINSLSENNFRINPLIELEKVGNCKLIATQGCFLGKAISLLSESIQKEDISISNDIKTNWKPLVFVFLNSDPEDNFIKYCNHYKKLNVITIVVVFDTNINLINLKLLSDNIIDGSTMDSSDIYKFFHWSEHKYPYSEETTSFSLNKINLKKL